MNSPERQRRAEERSPEAEPKRVPVKRVPVEEGRRDDEAVDIAVEDSFPASDPPSTTPSTTGAPIRDPAEIAPAGGPPPRPEGDEREGCEGERVPGTERRRRPAR